MKTGLSLLLPSALLGLSLQFASAAEYVSQYTTVDLKKCSNYTKVEGGEAATCPGPNGISLQLRVSDWTNLSIHYLGSSFSATDRLRDVGSFTQVGGANQVVEWISERADSGQVVPIALIARVEAMNPSNYQVVSQMLVFGFRHNGVCYVGRESSNEKARQLAQQFPEMACVDYLEQEGEPSFVTRTQSATIQSISLFNFRMSTAADSNSLVTGFFDISVKYCAFKKTSEPEFQVSGNSTIQKGVGLGGVYATRKTIPLSFAYETDLPKNVFVAGGCTPGTTVMKVKCEIEPGYDGASCEFKVNGTQTVSVEVFRIGGYGAVLY